MWVQAQTLASTGRKALQPRIPNQLRTTLNNWAPRTLLPHSPRRHESDSTSEISHTYARPDSPRWSTVYTRATQGFVRARQSREKAVPPLQPSWLATNALSSRTSARTIRFNPKFSKSATSRGMNTDTTGHPRHDRRQPQSAGGPRNLGYHLKSMISSPLDEPRKRGSGLGSADVVATPHLPIIQRQRSRSPTGIPSHNTSDGTPNKWAPIDEPAASFYRANDPNGLIHVGSPRTELAARPNRDTSANSNTDQRDLRAFEGELILDGTELAAWMIRQIAETLATAPMGTTGPDGRMAPTPAGTALFF
jgi:hypothetical protein